MRYQQCPLLSLRSYPPSLSALSRQIKELCPFESLIERSAPTGETSESKSSRSKINLTPEGMVIDIFSRLSGNVEIRKELRVE
ncbi:unnamed protein product [Cochlearia groenlandica]